MALDLVPLCSIDIVMGDTLLVGDGPSGFRAVAEVSSGAVHGERLSGTIAGNAMADWIVANGGVGTVDVRGILRTHDDALIHVSYGGRIDMSSGLPDGPIYVAPRFETSDERYRWLNLVQAVGVGTLLGQDLHYDWYEVRAGS